MISVKLPDGRTINVDTNDPKKAAEAGRRYIALGDARKRAATTPGQVRAVSRGATLNLSSLLDAGSAAAETAVGNAVKGFQGKKPSYGPREAFDAVRTAEGEAARQFSAAHPAQDLGLGLTGGLLMPGGSALARFIGPAKGLIGTAKAVGKGAAVGGALGAVAGGAGADPGGVRSGAIRGAQAGALVGGAAPAAVKVAGRAVNNPATRTVARAANRVTGGRLLNAQSEAAARMREALTKDGLDAPKIRTAMNEWLKTGASSPVLMDMAGENTRALIRGAAMKPGPARAAAVQYGNQVAADLQPEVIRRTRQLTPDRRPAQQVVDDLTEQRGTMADTDYPAAYATPVQPTEETMLALEGAPGRAAMQRARSAAEAQMRPERMAEIDRLMSGEDVPELSAGTLDRIRIAMGERAQQAARRGANDMRSGLVRRTGMIDDSLDAVDELQPARDAYRSMSGQIEGVDQGGTILNELPDEFAAMFPREMGPPRNIQTGQIGAARAIEGAVGRPKGDATGLLNRLTSSTNARRNLETLWGPDEAARYQDAIGNEVDRVNNARFINPNVGSQTAGRLADETLVEMPPMSKTGMLLGAVRAIQRGATLTDAEREQIVKLGLSGNLPPQAQSLLKVLSPYLGGAVAVPAAAYAGERFQ
jgi:hypothetical protein